jgi:hypothetical protein
MKVIHIMADGKERQSIHNKMVKVPESVLPKKIRQTKEKTRLIFGRDNF